MKYILTTAIVLSMLTTFGQNNTIDCNTILDKVPYFVRQSKGIVAEDSVLMDMQVLKNCGHLDEIDSMLLSLPMLASLMMMEETIDKEITYKTLLNLIDTFKQSESYIDFRNTMTAYKTLEVKIATPNITEEDRATLTKLGIDSAEIEALQLFIRDYPVPNSSFKEVLQAYSESMAMTEVQETLVWKLFTNLESALQESRTNGKKTLLYFSGHSSVLARKMEQVIFTDPLVKALIIADFNYYIAYADDKRINEATQNMIGLEHLQLQEGRFKTNHQPYFYILDSDGWVLSEIGYVTNIEDFIAFLNKGLE